MLGLQTLACLQDIPVVRSSTDKLQDVYAQAKKTSVLIRLPCNVAETVVDKSLKIALTVVNPFVKPFSGPVRAIDNYAAGKIRQIESKYPGINTPTEDVVQQGKDTVSHVAAATVTKASDVADSLRSLCGSGTQRSNSYKSSGLSGLVCSTSGSVLDFAFQSIQSSIIWFRMLVVFFLLKSKQINDLVLSKIQRQRLAVLPQRVLILVGTFLEFFITLTSPDDRTLAELKRPKQQSRYNQPTPFFANRPSFKQDPGTQSRQNVIPARADNGLTRPESVRNRSDPIVARQQVFVTKQETVVSRSSNSQPVPNSQPDYSNLTDTEQLYARLANNDARGSAYTVDNDEYIDEDVDGVTNDDIAELRAQINASDVELLYARLPTDVLLNTDEQETLNPDQQQLHARIIGAELERQGYQDN